ncbi:hypothetical protein MSAN_00986000 [Mycena sanguinolenta]|uniref:Uncharacterized protein n=1 Tax=Mycena sanguinolenta TaxID=230812 RepID=A0A8H6YNM7_9AGAR|nr:hypothetical protein MSAN_00986000 [Mycena sanguinolenta]
MAEQWALDAVEEEEASAEAVRNAATEKAQADKKAQRNKKRQQTEAARKRAKIALETTSSAVTDDGTSTMTGNTSGPGQPSPLRHGTAYMPDTPESAQYSDDPSHTFLLSGSGNPSPLRQTTVSMDSDVSPSKTDDKLPIILMGPGQPSPLRPRAPHAYVFFCRASISNGRYRTTESVGSRPNWAESIPFA